MWQAKRQLHAAGTPPPPRRAAFAILMLAAATALAALWGFGARYPAVAASSDSAARAPGEPTPLPYKDVEGALARALAELEPTGALAAFPGERFRPDRAITLGEFARLSAAAFRLTVPASGDAEHAAITALQERKVLPEGPAFQAGLPISRLNLVEATLRLAGLQDVFSVLGATGPAEAAAGLATSLGLFSAGGAVEAELTRPATRSEAVLVVDAARRLSVTGGRLEASPSPGSLRLNVDGKPAAVPLAGTALILRNGQPVKASELKAGDQVRAVLDSRGRALVVAASGIPAESEWAARARELLREVARQLTPEQWQAILRGDWESLAGSLTPQVYDRLMALGVAPWEAEALLNRDWAALRELAGERIAQEGAQRLNISPEVLKAVIDQDWPAARQLAQQELIQKVLDQVIGPAPGGETAPGGEPAAGSEPAQDSPTGPGPTPGAADDAQLQPGRPPGSRTPAAQLR